MTEKYKMFIKNRVKIIALLLWPFSWYLDQADKGFWLL